MDIDLWLSKEINIAGLVSRGYVINGVSWTAWFQAGQKWDVHENGPKIYTSHICNKYFVYNLFDLV